MLESRCASGGEAGGGGLGNLEGAHGRFWERPPVRGFENGHWAGFEKGCWVLKTARWVVLKNSFVVLKNRF